MDTDAQAGAAVALLTERGAEAMPHPGGTLLKHLHRVQATLLTWGEPAWIALAGLTHAAYGTDGFPQPLLALPERALLRDAIGGAAERLVYLYGSCDRASVYPQLGSVAPRFRNRFTGLEHRPGTGEVRAFAAITAANEIDVATHNAELMARARGELWSLFERMRRHLSAPAWQACVAAVAPAGYRP